MKKKISLIIAVFVMVLVTGYNVYNTQNGEKISTLALANVEAFANTDETSDQGTLYGNSAGTRYCCCPGTNSCGASDCSSC